MRAFVSSNPGGGAFALEYDGVVEVHRTGDGLSLREAVTVLEELGYKVVFPPVAHPCVEGNPLHRLPRA